MTRKDYVKLAEALAQAKPVIGDKKYPSSYINEVTRHAQWEHDCTKLADALEHDNPRFDCARFLVACEYFEVT